MLKTERKLVNLGQGAKNVFHLSFKSICVELASAHLKMRKAPKHWNNWRKVVFLLVLARSLCCATSVTERKQLAARSRGLSPQWQIHSHGLFCKCDPSNPWCSPLQAALQRCQWGLWVAGDGRSCRSCGLDQCRGWKWSQLAAIFWFI